MVHTILLYRLRRSEAWRRLVDRSGLQGRISDGLLWWLRFTSGFLQGRCCVAPYPFSLGAALSQRLFEATQRPDWSSHGGRRWQWDMGWRCGSLCGGEAASRFSGTLRIRYACQAKLSRLLRVNGFIHTTSTIINHHETLLHGCSVLTARCCGEFDISDCSPYQRTMVRHIQVENA